MELEHTQPRRDGFFFDQAAFRLDLYRLLCAFFATGDFQRLSRTLEHEPAVELADEFQEGEISLLLVGVAATVRVIQDRDARSMPKLNAACGRLWPDSRLPRSKVDLSLREACNKIIHASRFNFDAKLLPKAERKLPNPTYALRPIIHTRHTTRLVSSRSRALFWTCRVSRERSVPLVLSIEVGRDSVGPTCASQICLRSLPPA